MTAYLDGLAGDTSTALGRLEADDSPESLRQRLALLLDAKRYSDAAALVVGKAPHQAWCDLAIRALVLGGAKEAAGNVLAKVRQAFGSDREPVRLKCILAYAESLFGRAFARRKSPQVFPGSLSAEERDAVCEVVSVLQEIVERLRRDGLIKTRLELGLVLTAEKASVLLGQQTAAADLALLLFSYRPVPLEVVQPVRLGIVACPDDLPDRLRKEHPDSVRARILAATVEAECFSRFADAFENAMQLCEEANTTDDKRDLAFLLVHTSQCLDEAMRGRAWQGARRLLADNTSALAILEIEDLIRCGRLDEAVGRLDADGAADDPVWLQLRAKALLAKGDPIAASKLLCSAAESLLHPDLLRNAGAISLQAAQYDQAIGAFRRILDIRADDQQALHNLGVLYAQKGEFAVAAKYFGELSSLIPGDESCRLNLAMCLREAGRYADSIRVYDELCASGSPSLPAVFGKVQLLRSMGESTTAFACLKEYRSRFWDRPEFVSLWMDVGFSAGEDETAHEGLVRLTELQKAGRVDGKAFQAIPADHFLEFFKQAHKETQERSEYLHAEMLKGRMPWVWAEQVSKNAIYWGWRIRTQEMECIGDEPTNRARFCIYATNGFHARESERGRRELLPLECPPAGTKVVADVSALITLHRLGLLDATAEYFGEVLVPAGYLPTVLEDSREMVLNQRSQQQSAEQIAKQVTASHIVPLAEEAETAAAMAIADEYAESSEHRYRMRDLIGPIHQAGLVNDADFAGISRLCAKPSAVDEQHPSLGQFQNVMVGLTTLETVTNAGLLEAVAGFYRIRITAEAHQEVIQRLNAVAYQEETRQWHMDLWSRLRGNARFKFVPHTVPEAMRGEDRDDKDYLPFLACFIAQETKTPLLADDRSCQAFTLNEMADVPHAAFGSDVVALALMDAGKLDSGKAAAAIRQLMMCRYRFIVPPPEILKTLADQYRGNPPGLALREVAEYVHDCMRDPGLFGGPENTEVKDSMAMRLYLTWVSAIAEFLVLVWADEGFTPESATRLTEWSCREFLPSSPRVVDGRMNVRVGEMTPRLFLSHALLKTANHFGEPRMADAMTAMKNALRLSDDEYMRIVTGILNDTARTTPQS